MPAEILADLSRATDSNSDPLSGALWYFYATGTLTPQSVYTTAALSVAHANPVVADSGGQFPSIYFDAALQYRGILKTAGGVTLRDIDPINAGLASILAASSGSSAVGFLQAGTGAVARTAQAKLRETLSVFDFIPIAEHAAIQAGTTTTNVTSYINLALTYAKQVAYQEKTLVFPAGTYRVSQINLRDCNYVTLHAEGTVNIVGIDATQGWILGDDRLDDFGHLETFTQNLRMAGGPWLIGPLAGQAYQRGLKLQNIKDSVFENISVSGTYTPSGGVGNRIGVEVDLSFNNGFYNCNFGYPGAPIGAGKSYCLWLGGDNANNNRFYNLRAVGGGGTVAATVGARVDSQGNAFYGCDVSAIHTCFELNSARGAVFLNTYHEAVSRVAEVVFASTGCVFMPSYVDILANGTAYDFAGTSNYQTVGFQVIGGYHKFTGAGTTGVKKGINCYGLNYRPGIADASQPVTHATGTDVGSGGLSSFNGWEMATAKLTFPDTPVASANDTTLDCYQELTPTIGIKVGSTAQTVTTSALSTKIGRVVTVTGTVSMAAAVSGTGVVSITGLPNFAGNVASTAPSLSAVTYSGTPSLETVAASSEAGLYQTTEAGTRSQLTETSLSASSVIRFSLTYTADA